MEFESTIRFIKDTYPEDHPIPLHAPNIGALEERHVLNCLRSSFVSSVGEYSTLFENQLTEFFNPNFVVLTVNGTTALQIALITIGVAPGDLVITQALSFIATANAIRHVGADPIFLDVDKRSLGLSPQNLKKFIQEETHFCSGQLFHLKSGKKISAILPMHTFGHPVDIIKIKEIAEHWNLPLIEDAAESVGSTHHGQRAGTFGSAACISFNGNKIVTTGGGGAIIFKDKDKADYAKHLITTAKVKDEFKLLHDEVGYNFRMPSINAALGFAQFSSIIDILRKKRDLAKRYEHFFSNIKNIEFFTEKDCNKSNYWLNVILLDSPAHKLKFLKQSSKEGIMSRAAWELLSDLPMYRNCIKDNLLVSKYLVERLVCLPSSISS